jgi:glucose-6-phosphate dehydrogenase assembly protein OpcA
MEDVVSTSAPGLSPSRSDAVPFSQINAALARGACRDAAAMRALVATVVAVGPAERLVAAADTLRTLGDAGTVRGILISEGDEAAPPARVAGNTVTLEGLKSPFVNNAVAALRLSSLPTLVWWRGGRPETLDGVADLADRIVLDEEEPEAIWRRAAALFEDTAFSDTRWARLTQWRALMAHFFDIPEVRAAAPAFTRLYICGRDSMSARLFAAWLTASVRFGKGFRVDITRGDCDTPIQEVRLDNGDQELTLTLGETQSSLATTISVHGHRGASRIVSLARQTLSDLLTEELRIRARDFAFERAIRGLVGA